MNKRLKSLVVVSVLTALVTVSVLTGCSKKSVSSGDINTSQTKSKPTIKVGSKDFTESLILSELYAVALEKEGYKVYRKFNLGSAVVHTSLVNGDIDVYPEYTGTGLLSVLKQQPKFDSKEVYNEVSTKYKEKFKLIWLDPSSANDGQGLVISKRASDKYNIHTITDLQKRAGSIRFASQGQFDERLDGLQALTMAYGDFKFKDEKIYDNGIKYDVLHNDKADVAVAYTTEGQLSKTEFAILEDDKNAWPPYNIAPVIKQDLLEKNPQIKDILNKVTSKIDNVSIIKLNSEVDIDKKEYSEVAKNFFEKELAK
ncbi:glycine/betaine ABC transporter substrate-binding protein [Clostridium sp. CM028]|uniref:glycine betaine ABC transporter substrate-binding protein n=1 Tax=unclassified Clostridium TaxID=2614128 RepID=UPI001C6E5266|nr:MULTISPECIES: glycine betaine ABC transporter substrate-binding protein [unclassified Clostridium]MBW9145893.1 glycine/betaine ABC transporter substrate-binding protein [Clostridium sp. CM027]MBW9149582.1 glycine/betaine ABC transporter substrate-binding protein [Clostridium sp. CM028]UVE40872.1 glycine/betaine ABC transporter substrate-binding protein [Clostridium sp. CM027]WLC61540.1 glycine/betaine ABC transporter substrate-binding protein [Clostridium sp. CM028]